MHLICLSVCQQWHQELHDRGRPAIVVQIFQVTEGFVCTWEAERRKRFGSPTSMSQQLEEKTRHWESDREREREREREKEEGCSSWVDSSPFILNARGDKCWLAQDRPHKSPSIRHTTYCLLHSAWQSLSPFPLFLFFSSPLLLSIHSAFLFLCACFLFPSSCLSCLTFHRSTKKENLWNE